MSAITLSEATRAASKIAFDKWNSLSEEEKQQLMEAVIAKILDTQEPVEPEILDRVKQWREAETDPRLQRSLDNLIKKAEERTVSVKQMAILAAIAVPVLVVGGIGLARFGLLEDAGELLEDAGEVAQELIG